MLKVIITIAILFSVNNSNKPVEVLGEKVEKVLQRIDMEELYINDSSYYLSMLKVDFDAKSKVKKIAFADNIPKAINIKIDKARENYIRKYEVLDSLGKVFRFKNCTMLFPVKISPSDLIIKNISTQIIKQKNMVLFNGEYIQGNVFMGPLLSFYFVTRRIY